MLKIISVVIAGAFGPLSCLWAHRFLLLACPPSEPMLFTAHGLSPGLLSAEPTEPLDSFEEEDMIDSGVWVRASSRLKLSDNSLEGVPDSVSGAGDRRLQDQGGRASAEQSASRRRRSRRHASHSRNLDGVARAQRERLSSPWRQRHRGWIECGVPPAAHRQRNWSGFYSPPWPPLHRTRNRRRPFLPAWHRLRRT